MVYIEHSGLKRGTVKLYDNQAEWELNAKETIEVLHNILGQNAIDIQHIGSTAIKNIVAKPIIDIVIGVSDFEDVLKYNDVFEANGIVYRGEDNGKQLLYVMGDFENDTRTHHIHIVFWNKKEWNDYINFRDYMNAHIEDAKRYSNLKLELANKFYNDRKNYTKGKAELIDRVLEKARVWKGEHNMKKIIETDRLILRPIVLEDAKDVFEWVSDPVVNRYMPYALYKEVEQVEEWIKTLVEEENNFAFYEKNIDKVIGTGSISLKPGTDMFEVGYNLNQKYWGKGYATEAAKAMIKWAYDVLGARDFYAEFATANVGSGKVLEKCGFCFTKYGQYSRFDGSETFDATFMEMHLD